MPERIVDRLRDRLSESASYEGVVAAGYDSWISVDDVFADDVVHEHVVAEADGPTLELGCGTGRPMLRWLAAGHDVEGIDASADMLDRLRRHAEERGLDPVVHHGDIAPLDLDRTYAAIVCPAGTFTLIHDEDRITRALASYHDHLRPGGVLALTLSRLEPTGELSLQWRIRRTGPLPDGGTIMVHEAVLMEPGDPRQTIYNRLETFDPRGHLVDTQMRRMRLRSWSQAEIAEALAAAGFVDVRAMGDDEGWVSVARRPG